MEADTQAAEVAAKYGKIIKFAAAKQWKHWSALSDFERPFEPADFDQWALEAILLMAGLMKISRNEHTSERGRNLQSLAECEGHPGRVQRNVDYYVKDKASKAYRASRVAGRNFSASLDQPLDATESEDSTVLGDLLLMDGSDTTPIAIYNVREQFPLLHAEFIHGETQREIMARLGLGSPTYRKARAAEMAAFYRWAVANRRLHPGAEIPAPRGSGSRWGNRVDASR